MLYDVVIIGGGPAGLSAALALGRARKAVLVCDAGPRRNALAAHLHNFVTRDGTTPDAFRAIAREQLVPYASVVVRDVGVTSISGSRDAFSLRVRDEAIEARRVLLCTGMIDEALPIEGFAELWGHAIFQCPYCHGWEVRARPFGYLARDEAALHFAVMLRGWSSDVTVFTGGAFTLSSEGRARLETTGIRLETQPIEGLRRRDRALEGVALADGRVVVCEALFAHPPQRHVDVVTSLGLALDDEGFVRVDAMTRETSMPGVYAAGDLATRAQGAVFAAAAGVHAAAMLNHELTVALATAGLI